MQVNDNTVILVIGYGVPLGYGVSFAFVGLKNHYILIQISFDSKRVLCVFLWMSQHWFGKFITSVELDR